MARVSEQERLHRVHEEAMQRFDACQSAGREDRDQCAEDRRFGWLAGAQWEGLRAQYENKPMFEFNKVRPSVKRIETEYRNNPVSVSFVSKDGAKADRLADACASLYRSDEQDSGADEAYDNAFDEGTSGGFGAWRLSARYADEDDEDGEDDTDEARPQRIRFEPITDADSTVWFDINSKRQDKSDARYCFVITSMTPEEFKRQFDGEDPAEWPQTVHREEYDWCPPDLVRVAEYFVIEIERETVHVFEGLSGERVEHRESELTDPETGAELVRELEVTGFREVDQRKPNMRRVHKYLLSGSGVLEDCGYLPGRHIPIVPFYGQRAFIDRKERCMGHVRLQKDAQRILNMLISKLGELCGQASVEKPIVTPEQILGHENMWARDNIDNNAYLLLNKSVSPTGEELPQGPVGFTKSPSVPPAVAALSQLADVAQKEIAGNPDQAEKMISHVAGKTVELLQQRLDAHSVIYILNMVKAKRRSAQIWQSMARAVYVEPRRKMKGIDPRNQVTQIELMKPIIGPDGQMTAENDMTRAAFDVVATSGPTSDSKRQAAVSSVTKMLPMIQDPGLQAMLATVALMNIEGEGVEDVRAFARRDALRKGLAKPTPEEAQEMLAEAQEKPVDANEQLARSLAAEAAAKAQKAVADVSLTEAKVDQTKAETIATLADVDVSRQAAAVDAVKSLQELQASPGRPAGPGSVP